MFTTLPPIKVPKHESSSLTFDLSIDSYNVKLNYANVMVKQFFFCAIYAMKNFYIFNQTRRGGDESVVIAPAWSFQWYPDFSEISGE